MGLLYVGTTVICPNCKTEIRLKESLAAPLIEPTRRYYEKRLALKDTDVAKEHLLNSQQTKTEMVYQYLTGPASAIDSKP